MAVRAQVARWGNSLAVRIPKSIAETAHFSEGDTLVLEVEAQGSIAMKASTKPATLDELVAQITPENRHSVVDWGSPVGNEHW
jgi:antitoxin MazE